MAAIAATAYPIAAGSSVRCGHAVIVPVLSSMSDESVRCAHGRQEQEGIEGRDAKWMNGLRDWLKYLGFAIFGLGLFDIGPEHVFGSPGIFLPKV